MRNKNSEATETFIKKKPHYHTAQLSFQIREAKLILTYTYLIMIQFKKYKYLVINICILSHNQWENFLYPFNVLIGCQQEISVVAAAHAIQFDEILIIEKKLIAKQTE